MSGIPAPASGSSNRSLFPGVPLRQRNPGSATGSASLPNGSWTRPDSARTGPPGKDRRNDQAASGE